MTFALAPILLIAQSDQPDFRSVSTEGVSFSRLHLPAPKRIAEQFELIGQRGTDIVVDGSAQVFARSDSTEVLMTLHRNDRVHRVRQAGDWAIVRSLDGRVGYVAAEALSNVWILVSKSKQKVYVLEGTEMMASFDADMSVVPEGDKERRGGVSHPDQRRTPEGLFYISKLNPNSKFHSALVINYPTPRHAQQGLRRGIIDRAEYDEIVRAARMVENPPMYTRLGGWIEFHGSGVSGKANWTDGCIALSNGDMDALWTMVGVGTPVLIEP